MTSPVQPVPSLQPLVLVVEDEIQMLRFLRTILNTQGFKVLEALTGAEALSAAALRGPDVIVLDLGLPDMDGLEVITRLREWSRTPVVVLSARGQEGTRSRRSTRAPTTISPSPSARGNYSLACAWPSATRADPFRKTRSSNWVHCAWITCDGRCSSMAAKCT